MLAEEMRGWLGRIRTRSATTNNREYAALNPASFMFWAGAAYGAVVHVPIKSSLVLKPNQAYSITTEATEPIEIGWRAVQSKACTTDCVQATDVTGGNNTIATALGATKKYTPASGKISVKYKNVFSQPVTIDVYRVQPTCDAEACKFLDQGQKGRWLVYKIDEFDAIATSKDGSYSIISGATIGGRPPASERFGGSMTKRH